MVETSGYIMDGEDKGKKVKSGIKNFTFTSSGKNGESHRKNKVKKHRQYLKNKEIRAGLNQERGRLGALEYHSRLKSLSMGTA